MLRKLPEEALPAPVLDQEFLTRTKRPAYERRRPRIHVVDLFCGCGGMSLGVAEAARRLGLGMSIPFAVDFDANAHAVYRANFRGAGVKLGDVCSYFDGVVGTKPTDAESGVMGCVSRPTLLLAGPPCQGHSDLNNHTRRNDPRNALYQRAVRAAEVLSPEAAIIENVPTVTWDKDGVVDLAIETLEKGSYSVHAGIVDIAALGLPQLRRRHVLLAVRKDCLGDSSAADLFARATTRKGPRRSIGWAIGDLLEPRNKGALDEPAAISARNAERIAWLFANKEYDLPNALRPRCHHGDHSYKSVYGRLDWKTPAQTITTGFTSMGQGRYVHPKRQRTLTPHEAARLQGFPDFFDFTAASGRTAWAKLIGNAVPPILATALAFEILRTLERTWHGRPT